MKEWNVKTKSSIQEVIDKLDSTLGKANGFVFDVDTIKNDLVKFKVRKRGLYAFQVLFQNRITLHGKVLKNESKNETDIEISFKQDFLTKLLIFLYILLGFSFTISTILSGMDSNLYMLILGGILLLTGIALWFDVKKRFEKNINKYKKLISEILK